MIRNHHLTVDDFAWSVVVFPSGLAWEGIEGRSPPRQTLPPPGESPPAASKTEPQTYLQTPGARVLLPLRRRDAAKLGICDIQLRIAKIRRIA